MEHGGVRETGLGGQAIPEIFEGEEDGRARAGVGDRRE